jgi:hypothetical protein
MAGRGRLLAGFRPRAGRAGNGYQALSEGYISVTPLGLDQATDGRPGP